MRLTGVLLVFMGLLAACGSETAQNAAQAGLEVDIRDSIAAQGITSAPALNCTESDTGGYCVTTLTPGEVDQFVRNIGMNAFVVAGMSFMEGCGLLSEFSDVSAAGYNVAGSPPPLTLANGNRFSSITLFYREDTQAACIEVSYVRP
ncbi:MAG: hypothetical protein AAFV33_02970 [Chloroflexota bacterium]